MVKPHQVVESKHSGTLKARWGCFPEVSTVDLTSFQPNSFFPQKSSDLALPSSDDHIYAFFIRIFCVFV